MVLQDGEVERRTTDFLARHAGSVALVAIGAILVAFSLAMYVIERRAQILGFTFLGVVAAAWGASLPRVEEAEVSPQKAKFKLSPTQERVDAVEIASAETVTPDLVDEPREIVVASRNALAGEALVRVLRPPEDSVLHGDDLRLYLYDADLDRLSPVMLPDEKDEEVQEWAIGQGATGTAFEREEFVLAEGDAVWDRTHGLNEQQSERFRHLTAVASMPVFNASDEIIGVLTASTSKPLGGALVTEDGYIDLLSRSLAISRVLVDLLGWFPDRYDDPDGD